MSFICVDGLESLKRGWWDLELESDFGAPFAALRNLIWWSWFDCDVKMEKKRLIYFVVFFVL